MSYNSCNAVCIKCRHSSPKYVSTYADGGIRLWSKARCFATARSVEGEMNPVTGNVPKSVIGIEDCSDRNPDGNCELFKRRTIFQAIKRIGART